MLPTADDPSCPQVIEFDYASPVRLPPEVSWFSEEEFLEVKQHVAKAASRAKEQIKKQISAARSAESTGRKVVGNPGVQSSSSVGDELKRKPAVERSNAMCSARSDPVSTRGSSCRDSQREPQGNQTRVRENTLISLYHVYSDPVRFMYYRFYLEVTDFLAKKVGNHKLSLEMLVEVNAYKRTSVFD